MTSLFDRYLQESDAFAKKTPELTKLQRCLKSFLITINVIFLIFACALIGIGSVAYNHNVGPLTGATIPQGIIALGVFIMLLSLFGIFGAYRESRLFLGCYFFFLLIFTVLLLAVGIGVYSQQQQAGWYITQGWQSANDGVRMSFQNAFYCCGLTSWTDNPGSTCPTCTTGTNTTCTPCPIYYPGTNGSAPFCVPCTTIGVPCPNQNCTLCPNITAICNPCANQTGCYQTLVNTFNNSYQTMGAVSIALAVLMFFGMVFVCILIRGIRAKSEKTDNEGLHSGEDSANPAGTASIDSTT